MIPAKAKAYTSLLRMGNRWLVGHNYSRVAPIFFLNSLLRSEASKGATERVARILDLLQEADPAEVNGLPIDIDQAEGISIAIRGALAADRRAFGTPSGSALFPVSSRLIMGTSSDDGLGTLARELLNASSVREEFSEQLRSILDTAGLGVSQVEDPISRFGHLLAGPAVDPGGPLSPATTPAVGLGSRGNAFDERLAVFVVRAFRTGPRTQRLSALRSLAHAGYLASILRMLQGPLVERTGSPRMVIVYAGLPPGNPSEPTSAAAIASLRSVVRASWESTVELASQMLDEVTSGDGSGDSERLRRGIRATIGAKLSKEIKLEEMFSSRAELSAGLTTLREFVIEGLGGGPETFSQRIRGLATKIGFVAPDRGAGGIRLALDTPLLAVLVNGLVPESTLGFERFVTKLRTELGLVLGIGEDDSFVQDLENETFGGRGRPIYDVLMENEQELRQRLIRTGLARTYSDAHTEVISSDA